MEELLSLNKYEVDDECAHIELDKEICRECLSKICAFVCPAGLYTLKGEEISFDYAGCLECGTCRVACPRGGIKWNYPRGGFGVVYRYG